MQQLPGAGGDFYFNALLDRLDLRVLLKALLLPPELRLERKGGVRVSDLRDWRHVGTYPTADALREMSCHASAT